MGVSLDRSPLYRNRVRTSTAWEADLRACLSVTNDANMNSSLVMMHLTQQSLVQMLHRFNCIRRKSQVVHDP